MRNATTHHQHRVANGQESAFSLVTYRESSEAADVMPVKVNLSKESRLVFANCASNGYVSAISADGALSGNGLSEEQRRYS